MDVVAAGHGGPQFFGTPTQPFMSLETSHQTPGAERGLRSAPGWCIQLVIDNSICCRLAVMRVFVFEV